MKSTEIVLLSTLVLIGALTSALPSWPQQQIRTIERLEPASRRVAIVGATDRGHALRVHTYLERLPHATRL